MNRILRWLDLGLAGIFKPFWDADSYESYSTAGYFLGLLVWVPLLCFILVTSGYGSVTFAQLHPTLEWLIKTGAGKIGATEPPEKLELWYLVVVFYILAGLSQAARFHLGRLSAALFFAIMNMIVALGEFCIEQRWLSLFLIFALSFGIGWGFTYLNEKEKRRLSINHAYNCWLESVEEFVEENPVTEVETERYEKVRAAWSDDFKSVLETHSGQVHPSECLLKLIDEIHKQEEDLAYRISLGLNLEKVNQVAARCKPRPSSVMSLSEAKAWALVNLLMGRVHNRVSEGQPEGKHLKTAKEHFEAMSVELFKDDTDAKRYRSAQRNGYGTVYALAFSAKLENEQVDLKGICDDSRACLILAEQEYEAAGEGYPPCSFQQKRMQNNIADLRIRMGYDFGKLKRRTTAKLDHLLNDPLKLAEDIKLHVGKMMKCNKTDPIISTDFLTAAQAFGTSVKLGKLGKAPVDVLTDDTAAAAYYLRLAHSFEPQNFTEEDLVYFCSITQDAALEPIFRRGLDANHGGMPVPNVESLMQTIGQAKCR